MRTSAVALWTPKSGHSKDEYEDAFQLDLERNLFAVADGASESSFARQWARLLVDRFVELPAEAGGLREWLEPPQRAWARENGAKRLPWYAEEKARDGAFSSLLGVAIDADAGRWTALAVGDSCAFVVRRNRLLHAFPISDWKEFARPPILLSSVARSNEGVWDAVRGAAEPIQAGDRILLMTDALAQWFLVEARLKRRPWAALDRARTPEGFESLVGFLRGGGALRNDDVTLIAVEVEG